MLTLLDDVWSRMRCLTALPLSCRRCCRGRAGSQHRAHEPRPAPTSRATSGSETASACASGLESGRRGSAASGTPPRRRRCGAASLSATTLRTSGSSCGCCWTSPGASSISQRGEVRPPSGFLQGPYFGCYLYVTIHASFVHGQPCIVQHANVHLCSFRTTLLSSAHVSLPLQQIPVIKRRQMSECRDGCV